MVVVPDTLHVHLLPFLQDMSVVLKLKNTIVYLYNHIHTIHV